MPSVGSQMPWEGGQIPLGGADNPGEGGRYAFGALSCQSALGHTPRLDHAPITAPFREVGVVSSNPALCPALPLAPCSAHAHFCITPPLLSSTSGVSFYFRVGRCGGAWWAPCPLYSLPCCRA